METDTDVTVDIDSYEEGDTQALRDSLQWEASSNPSPADSTSTSYSKPHICSFTTKYLNDLDIILSQQCIAMRTFDQIFGWYLQILDLHLLFYVLTLVELHIMYYEWRENEIKK